MYLPLDLSLFLGNLCRTPGCFNASRREGEMAFFSKGDLPRARFYRFGLRETMLGLREEKPKSKVEKWSGRWTVVFLIDRLSNAG